ncbi:TIM-barrel domain-containing protein [Paenibacillus puerhi]|uniref:TIM-barrel domain-containing protein n=1 Tax=Paenibacillus puerhi TaxID=2692622 RepID=UPI001F2B77A4|nr:TIM-barrel domain-containing protein [Paenibacillus puerhi]
MMMTMLHWRQTAPGIWSATAGEPSDFTPLGVLEPAPKVEALEAMGGTEPPFAWSDVQITVNQSNMIISFPLEEEEEIYGTGLQFMRMNQRGRTRYLRVNSDPKQDTGETHAPVPFYVSGKGYGVLADTSAIVTIYCGSTVRYEDSKLETVKDRNTDKSWRATPVSSRVEIRLPAEGARLYVFGGPTTEDAVRRYNLFCGGGTLPPKWGLGFWHRVPTMYNAAQALDEAMEFRKRGFPCDVIGLEPGWHTKSYPVTYEWDPGRFPEPSVFVQAMREQGFRINLWEHPFISPEASIYQELKPLSGSHTVWGGLAPDYSLPEARELYMKQHAEQHVAIGVSGYKLDECDGSDLTNHSWMFPAHASFPSGHDGERMRQMYGLLLQKMTADVFRREDRRTYGLVRASGTGASELPYVLYSDLYDHRQFVRALCNASFCGLLWTPEVRRAATPEEWVRRMQTVCFSPLAMLNAWGDGTKPWSFPEVEPIIRHYIRLRMRLLPYLYTAFARYRHEGIPPFRAMPFAFTTAERFREAAGRLAEGEQVLNTTDGAYGKQKAKEWDDQYMVGEDLLVAPVFTGESAREVLLPPGGWYGLETGLRYEGGRIIRVEAQLDQIPVFVRDGAVIPTMRAASHVPGIGEPNELIWLHFGTAPGSGWLYDDDGETFAYEQGEYAWTTAQVTASPAGEPELNLTRTGASIETFDKVSWRLGLSKLPQES